MSNNSLCCRNINHLGEILADRGVKKSKIVERAGKQQLPSVIIEMRGGAVW